MKPRPVVKIRESTSPPRAPLTRPPTFTSNLFQEMRDDATTPTPAMMISQAKTLLERSMEVNTYQPTPRPSRKPPNPRLGDLDTSASLLCHENSNFLLQYHSLSGEECGAPFFKGF